MLRVSARQAYLSEGNNEVRELHDARVRCNRRVPSLPTIGTSVSLAGLARRGRAGSQSMNHLRTACVAFAFVATTVSGSAQTSLTPSQNTTNSRTIIPQPPPVMRERIVNPSAEGLGAAEQPPAQNNLFVNGALAVAGAPANTDTVPAKFSAKNADDDELITIAYAFKTLTDDERRAVYQALKDQSAGSAFNADIGTKLPPGIELRPVPEELAARVPQTRDYR